MSCEECKQAGVLLRIQNDIVDLFKRVIELEKTSSGFGVKLDIINQQLEKLITKVDALCNIPGSRWNTVVTIAITAIVSGTIGAVISKLF